MHLETLKSAKEKAAALLLARYSDIVDSHSLNKWLAVKPPLNP